MKPARTARGAIYDGTPLNKPIKELQEKWRLVPALLQVRGLVRQHIESFNYFVNVDIKKIVKANEKITSNVHDFYLKYQSIHVGEPSVDEEFVDTAVTPQECRLRDMSYSAPIIVDIEYLRAKQIVTRKAVVIGRLPIMLRSCKCVLHQKTHEQLAKARECPLDPGGYFVIKGFEKVILIQEQLSKNRVLVEEDATGMLAATVTSSTHERKSRTSVVLKNDKLYLRHNTFSEDIPIGIVFKVMGVQSDQEMVELIGVEHARRLASSMEECASFNVYNGAQALSFLAAKVRQRMFATRKSRIDEARDIMAQVVLSHIPVYRYNFKPKAALLVHMVRRIFLAEMDRTTLDDKDYYGNKRLELAGHLLALLFEDLFKRFNADIKRTAENMLSKPNRAGDFDAVKCIRPDLITNGFVHAIQSGNWTLRRFRMERQGVTEVLSRLSFISALGMMTRIQSLFEKTRKVSGPRSLQASQWGCICPADTPEGESCGLVKNLALLTHVTTDEEEEPLARLCYNLGVEDVCALSGQVINSHYVVFLNGSIVGIHRKPAAFISAFRAFRRNGYMSEFVSIHADEATKTIFVAADGGRVCRPLIIVEQGQPRLKQRHLDELKEGYKAFDDFLREGLVEFLDVNEENLCYIALNDKDITPNTTHLEIDTTTILGICASLIPYPHHNQSPRNTYQCAMGKQAMGTIGYNQFHRLDTQLYLLVYPQRPLVSTRNLDLVNFVKLPAGQNAVIAVMSFSGYDIEDAIIMNKSGVERGLGRCIVLRKYTTQMRRYPNQSRDSLMPPPQDMEDRRNAKYRALDGDGIVCEGTKLQGGSVFVNKYSPIDAAGDMAGVDGARSVQARATPSSYRGTEEVAVDRVLLTSNEEDQFLIKVLTRHVRTPEIGDKFSREHSVMTPPGPYVPTGQLIHAVCPGEGWNSPTGQSAH